MPTKIKVENHVSNYDFERIVHLNYLDVAVRIIPGYDTLSKRQRRVFEASIIGRQCSPFIEKIIADVTILNASIGWWDAISGRVETRIQSFREQFEQQTEELIGKIEHSDEYKSVVMQIAINLLKNEYPDFKLLSKKHQKILAKTEFSHDFVNKLHSIDKLISQEKQQLHLVIPISSMMSSMTSEHIRITAHIAELKEQRQRAIEDLRQAFLSSPTLRSLRTNIASRKQALEILKTIVVLDKLHQHAIELAHFFPFLLYKKSSSEEPLVTQLRLSYNLDTGKITSSPETVDEEYLTDVLFYYMKKINQVEIEFINLDTFHKTQARHLAQSLMNCFHDKEKPDMEALFARYEAELQQHIIEQLRLIKGQPFQLPQQKPPNRIMQSLSYLFNNKTVKSVNNFMRRLADAHGFIQATGFATQNESSYLAILDLYNYNHYLEQITEAKSIVLSLFSPLRPLYDEYKDIAFYEKNTFTKIVRTLMPLIITVAFIVLVAFVLSPLELPELAFAAVLIPAFLIGIDLAATYTTVKNNVYNKVRGLYYGGSFEIPEFQCNERMTTAFFSRENALLVRKLYIDALASCDQTEATFQAQHARGLLSEDDIAERKKNIEKRHLLCLEWYDIHSNQDLSYRSLASIVLNRIQETSVHEYQILESTLMEERDEIGSSATQATADLKKTITDHNRLPMDEDNSPETHVIRTNYRAGLFGTPRCLTHKKNLEAMADLREHLTA